MLIGALDDQRARDLRVHIETCEGCRGYLSQLAAVTEKLAAIEVGSEIEASESFHQKLAGRLRAEESMSFWESATAHFRAVFPGRRVAWTATAASAVAVAALFISLAHHGVFKSAEYSDQRDENDPSLAHRRFSGPAQSAAKVAPGPDADRIQGDLAPTIANYQMVANRSLEQFDDLLTRQGNRNPPSLPVYTASTFVAANAAD